MTTETTPSIGLYRKEIVWERETRDFRMELDGEFVGYARTYHEAVIELDRLVLELISAERFVGAA